MTATAKTQLSLALDSSDLEICQCCRKAAAAIGIQEVVTKGRVRAVRSSSLCERCYLDEFKRGGQ